MVDINTQSMVRAMATCLLDNDADLLDWASIITVLIRAGWHAAELNVHVEPAVSMALIRKQSEIDRRYRA